MKKHLVLIFIFACTVIANVQAQSLTAPRTQAPEVTVQKIRKVAEEQFGVFNRRDNDYDRDRCDCDKCQKQKKSKKHGDCDQKGKHYGKHKNHHDKHSCSCDHDRCQSGKQHDQDEDRCGWNGRNGRDDDDRYGSTRRDRDDDDRQQPQAGQRKPTPKVKSRPVPTTTKPTSTTKTGAKRKVNTRPAGTRQ